MRVIAIIGVGTAVLLLPLYVALPFVVLYALWRPAYELIIIGMLIDAQFGSIASFGYIYTLTFGTLVLLAEVLKPHLAFYNEEQQQ